MQETERLYFDNAATSRPKAPGVMEAMARYAIESGASPGRGAYREARESGEVFDACRAAIDRLIGGAGPERVIFTLNTSDALHLAIKGIAMRHVSRGEPVHLVTTCMDHNSVLRPFNQLVQRFGATQTRVACDPETGLVDPAAIEGAIREDTRLVAVVHGSNVTGTLQPIAPIGAACRSRGVPLLVDAAQTVGHVPVDVRSMGIDLLAFPGHKGLLGPLGTGVLYVGEGMEDRLDTVREGGTGSVSESDVHPLTMPDRFEAGSHNAIGIYGLLEAVRWIHEQGVDAMWAHERALMARMLERLHDLDIPGLRLLGPQGVDNRVGVFSFVAEGMPPGAIADALEREAGVLCRAGLHCAPLAHKTMGTSPEQVGDAMCGATRLSIGAFTTLSEVDRACEAIGLVCGARTDATLVGGASS